MKIPDNVFLWINAGLLGIVTWFIRSWVVVITRRLEECEKKIVDLQIQVAKNESHSKVKT